MFGAPVDLEIPLACLLALLALPWLLAVLCRRFDVVSPVLLFTVYIFIGYVVPIPVFLTGLDRVTLGWTNLYSDFEGSVVRALWVTVLAVAGFYLGYIALRDLVPGAERPVVGRPVIRWRGARFRLVGFGYTVGGLAVFSAGVAIIGGPAALLVGLSDRVTVFAGLNYFFSAVNLLLVVSLIWWVRVLTERRAPGAAFWLFTVSAVALAGLQGSKAIILIFFLSTILSYHMLRQRISVVKLGLLGGLIIVYVSFYAIYVREFLTFGELVSLEPTDNWAEFAFLIVSTTLAGDFIQLQALTLVVDMVPAVMPFQNGQTLLAMLTIAIPAGLYPEKYVTAPGVFTRALVPARSPLDSTTLPPGLVGELYMNFGAPGVLFGLIAFGAVYGWLRRMVKQRESDPVVVTFYAMAVAMMVHYLRGELVSPTVLYLILAVPTAVAFRVTLDRRKSQEHVAVPAVPDARDGRVP